MTTIYTDRNPKPYLDQFNELLDTVPRERQPEALVAWLGNEMDRLSYDPEDLAS